MDLCATFDASIDRLPFILDWVEQRLDGLQLNPKQSRRIVLAVEEAVMNTIQHGYAGQEGAIQIAIQAISKGKLPLIIKDWAIAFNPLTKTLQADFEDSLEDKAIGGLGMHLIRHYVERLDYTREGDCNVLTLIFDITHSSQIK